MKKLSRCVITLSMLSAFSTSAYAAKIDAKAAANHVEEAPLRAHLQFLSSDLLEGRGTGQRGGDLTVAYLEAQARAIGLLPIDGKTYRHPVKLAFSTLRQEESTLAFEANGQKLPFKFTDDWVWSMGDAATSHNLDSELVFVGYGINAPDEHWDDYKGVDVRGKVLIMMVNDPQPTAQEPNRFGGESLTYYGRWTYKYEEAQRRGAAAVILIHTDKSASYQWSVAGNGGNKFLLESDQVGTPIQGWMRENVARQLFQAAGLDLDQLRASAENKEFKPVNMNVKLRGAAHAEVRKITQYNVAGLIPGTDPKLKDELVVYSAHWDHLGMKQGDGDVIYNGAVDNGSGSAALLAMAKAAVKAPTKRSQLFLWVAAEEKGLLQKSDPTVLKTIVTEVIAENPTQVADYKSGKESMFMYFVGQCMKKSKGAGNPTVFQELLKEVLR